MKRLIRAALPQKLELGGSPGASPLPSLKRGSAARQEAAFEALKSWQKPVHVIFGASDPIFAPEWGPEVGRE